LPQLVNGVALELLEGGEDDTLCFFYRGVGFKDFVQHYRIGVCVGVGITSANLIDFVPGM
jgi:hypothetical protein